MKMAEDGSEKSAKLAQSRQRLQIIVVIWYFPNDNVRPHNELFNNRQQQLRQQASEG